MCDLIHISTYFLNANKSLTILGKKKKAKH